MAKPRSKTRVTKTPCVVRTGTASGLTPWRNCDSEARARTILTAFFRSHLEFARSRRGASGEDAVLNVISAIGMTAIHNEGTVLRCTIDPYTNFTVVAEVAHGVWDPKLKRVIIP